jgi:carboxyl-terminal processing protease
VGISRALLVTLFALFLGACSVLPQDIGAQIVPTRTDYKTLEAAYHVLLERHVDRPGSQQLLTGALEGAEAYLVKSIDEKGAGCTSASVARPELTGSTESDLLKLSGALTAALASCPTADKTQVERAATDGMAKSMNECHTYYLDPDRAKTFNQAPQEYSGIGATILAPSEEGGMSQIASVFPNSPAEKAGVRPGDRIKSVDGTDVTTFAPEEIAQRIRGDEGTQVVLILVRAQQDVTFTITRAKLIPPRVFDRQHEEGQITQLTISALNGDVARQTKETVQREIDRGVKGFVLDLRNNPGGDLSAAVNIASIFVKDATLVKQVGRDGKAEQLTTNGDFYVGFSGPIVVLVNERSASGAEIIAAGLRANDVASVVGTRTAGCVGIAQPRAMPDDGLLLVTLARMQDAKSGEELNGKGRGVNPDSTVPNPAETAEEEDLLAALAAVKDQIARTG